MGANFPPRGRLSVPQQYPCTSLAAAGAEGGQEQRGAGNSPPKLDEATWLLAGAELEEDDLDIIPPSPEEELPPFSPSVQSVR